ncbi:PilT protein domain protein [Xylanimonas cellulosilytica DSM 15894]|uniref:PilT protein domain protein n=1 Tax=Xylanimonas cellulosilytica (strain DSM 15894 / JCM 12276 / CECT 5975 / KCTC 9989 / LMG 20990 / NBRC 107835 / XIL07) TaxID=446471 RepID=D1BX66_XYLCX|nr:PIN domain-containing protein [Xylanimonas cellulosilytica]ACZ31634.1 PilT protein domain protein [Xylanimonas cellulosilytica DSM 15894]
MRALLDTNILVALMSAEEEDPDLDEVDESWVSSLTWTELLLGMHVTDKLGIYKERASRLDHLQSAFGPGLPFDDECVEMYGEILSRVDQRRGSPRAHRFDRMIAATAMANDLVLVTRNAADFTMLDDLLDVVER